MSVTITSKGQVTISKAVRSRLHLKTGDKLEFVLHKIVWRSSPLAVQ